MKKKINDIDISKINKKKSILNNKNKLKWVQKKLKIINQMIKKIKL